MTFLDYYRENLAHIRTLGSEFAAEFPKIAARLELSEFECRDPYVERLLEGTAFLAARVEKKLDDGFPRLLETLLSAVAPAALFPSPSLSVLELQPSHQDERLKNGFLLKGGSVFQCPVEGIRTPCSYSTTSDMTLYPLALTEADYSTRDLEKYHIASAGAQAALCLKLERSDNGQLSELNTDELSIFLNLPESDASLLQGQLIVDLTGIYAGTEEHYEQYGKAVVDLPMFADNFMITSSRFRQLCGLQILQQYLAYPSAFKFFRIRGLRELFRKAEGSAVQLVFALKRRENCFIHDISRENFKLWCIPAVNIFRKNSDRSEVNGQYEFHVVPERTAPLDYEVFRINSVETYNERNETLFRCFDFYDETGKNGRKNRDFFSLHRRKRLVNDTRTARSSYAGSEAFISFSGENWKKRWEEVKQFRAEMWCTNRDLPLLTRTDAVLNAPDGCAVKSALFAVAPSRPRYSLVQQGAGDDWKTVGHIVLNLSSVLWQAGEIPVDILKQLIRSYSVRSEEETERLLDGITEIRTASKTFRFIHKGCVFFENGWQIQITLSEQQYAGAGYFIFAAVLRELLYSYTPLNSCVELVIHTDKRMNVVTWKIQEKQ